jgi:hypothetical protein
MNPKETLDKSLLLRLRKILRRNFILGNELTFYNLTSSKNGVSAQKIRKMSGMELSRYSPRKDWINTVLKINDEQVHSDDLQNFILAPHEMRCAT